MGADKKPILCLDFDGVVHEYSSGWQGATVIPDPPVNGMWEALEAYTNKFEVNIFSTRSNHEGGVAAMLAWFLKNAHNDRQRGIAIALKFPTQKPPALVTIDDRAVTFTGSWPDVNELLAFQPWNKK